MWIALGGSFSMSAKHIKHTVVIVSPNREKKEILHCKEESEELNIYK